MKEKLDLSHIALYLNPANINLTHSSGTHFGTWRLQFVSVQEDGAVRNLDLYSRTNRMFSAVRFSAQWELNNRSVGVYGDRVSLRDLRDINHVNEAQDLVDMMKMIEKVRDSFTISPQALDSSSS